KYLGIFFFLVSSNLYLSTIALHLWEYETISSEDIKVPYDIGIVLGPFVDDARNMAIRSEAVRFTQSVHLYKTNKFHKFLLAGNDKSELTRQHLINLCVPPEDILVEDKSNNTYENALLSKRLLAQKGAVPNKILLITSAVHMRRAKACFEKVGLNVTPFSVDYRTSVSKTWGLSFSDIIPNDAAFDKWRRVIYEWGCTVYFKMEGYI
ncbi:MAG: YdcF family protein, partial [Bacteroidota bacterium]